MPRGVTRCPQCGLTQYAASTCRRCGAAFSSGRVVSRPWTPPRSSTLQAIWLSPRTAIRGLVDRDPTRGVILLTWFAGLGSFLTALASSVDDRFPFAFAALMALVVGPLLGFTVVFVAGFLTTWTGRALGGSGSFVELRAALAWAQAPLLLFLILWVPRVLAPGHWELPLDLTELALFLWSEMLAVVLVAEVHGVSIPRGILAVLIAWAIKLALIVSALFAVVP